MSWIARAGPGDLRGLRFLVFGAVVVHAIVEPIDRLAGFPAAALAPRFPLAALSGGTLETLFSGTPLLALRLGTGAAAVLAALLRRPPAPVLLVAAALFTVHQALLGSLGYFGHGTLPVLLGAWVLALDRRPARPQAPVFTVLFILLFGYALTGIHRLAHGTPDVFAGGSLSYWAVRNACWDCWEADVAGWFSGLRDPLLRCAEAAFPVVTVLEMLAPCALLGRRSAAAVLVLLLGFHLGSAVLLGIVFWENALLLIFLLGWVAWRPERDITRRSATPGSSG